MPTDYSFIGTTDGDFGTATNWDPNGVPDTGDSWAMTGDATRSIDGADYSSKTFARVHVTPECGYNFGTAATPLQFNATDFRFAGKGGASYAKGSIARAFIDSQGDSPDLLHLDCLFSDFISCQNGHVHLDGVREIAAGAQIICTGGTLEIGANVDLTTNSVPVYQSGGDLAAYSNLGTVYQSDGQLYTYEAVTLTTLFGSGRGRFFWLSSGTVTAAYLFGSYVFDGDQVDIARTLTGAEMHADSQMLLRKNTMLTLGANGIRAVGSKSPQLPCGRKISIT